MAKSHLKLVAPIEVLRTVAPTRRPNAELRTREHLIRSEIEALIEAAKANRYGHRDATMILIAFRHGLRASELCDLRWDQVEFGAAVLHVRRVKNGTPSTHPLRGDELRALRRLQRESETSPFVFVSERGSPFTTAGFARMMERFRPRTEGASAHAPARVRLRPRQQGPRHPGHPGVARPSLDHQHRGLHRTTDRQNCHFFHNQRQQVAPFPRRKSLRRLARLCRSWRAHEQRRPDSG